MKKLFKISALVKELLIDIPETRNSDSYLYLKVLERIAADSGNPVNLDNISVPYFFCNVQNLKFPYFQTVSRARRKIQEKCPELKGNKKVQAVRQRKEEVFRDFSRAEVG